MVCRVKDRSEFQGLKTAFAPVSLGPHAIDIGASVIRFNAPPRRRFGAMAERRDWRPAARERRHRQVWDRL